MRLRQRRVAAGSSYLAAIPICTALKNIECAQNLQVTMSPRVACIGICRVALNVDEISGNLPVCCFTDRTPLPAALALAMNDDTEKFLMPPLPLARTRVQHLRRCLASKCQSSLRRCEPWTGAAHAPWSSLFFPLSEPARHSAQRGMRSISRTSSGRFQFSA